MTRTEHFAKLQAGDLSPRIVLHDNRAPSDWRYVAWTPTWEGPARFDYPAAAADLADRLRLAALEADVISAANKCMKGSLAEKRAAKQAYTAAFKTMAAFKVSLGMTP